MSEQGIRMTEYKEVRRTMGTIHYQYQDQRLDLYEHIRVHPQDLEALILDDGGRHKKKNKHKYRKKTIEIVDKQDKMKDIVSPVDTGEDTKDKEETVQGPTEITTTTIAESESVDKEDKEDKEDKVDKPVGGKLSTMKTIRVTDVSADKKKAGLVL